MKVYDFYPDVIIIWNIHGLMISPVLNPSSISFYEKKNNEYLIISHVMKSRDNSFVKMISLLKIHLSMVMMKMIILLKNSKILLNF